MSDGPDRSAAYRLIRKLGSLYHSQIHLAEWSGVEGFIKQMTVWHVRPELCLDTDAVDILLGGLKGAAALSASTATQVLDVWWARDRIAIAAEHLSGISMTTAARQAMEQSQLLPFDTIMMALLEVARALEQAHDGETRGGVVVHGDLRPEYVLFGYEGAVKISGFGFADFLPKVSPRGEWSVWHGRCYQPPERLAGAPASPATDVFSLGVMLWEAATGLLPYGTDDRQQLLDKVGAGENPLGEGPLEIANDLGEVIRRACSLDPNRRFPSMSEMAAELYKIVIERRRAGESRPMRLRELLKSISDKDGGSWDSSEDSTVVPSPKSQVLKIPRLPIISPMPKVPMPQTPLLGRVEILRAVSQSLAALNTGKGQAILLTGEAGMGRTRLLTEIAVRLSSSKRKLAWLPVQCRPNEKTHQYAAVLRLFSSAVGLDAWSEPSELLPQLDRLRAFGLDAATLNAIRGVLGEGVPPEPARLAGLLSKGVIQVLTSLSWEQTTIVAWDDLQWTDDSSLSCVVDLLDQLGTIPVVVLLTASDDFEPPWESLLALRAIRLGPLSIEECEGLVVRRMGAADWVESSLMENLLERSGGNPLLVEQLSELLIEGERLEIEGRVIKLAEGQPEGVPGITEGVRSRLRTFSEEVMTVAVTAALAGPALDQQVVARATGLSVDRSRHCLDELLERAVLRQRRAGFAFPHERLRLALLEAAGDDWLDALRGATARAVIAEAKAESEGWRDHAANLLIEAGDQAESAEVLVASAKHKESRGDLRGAAQRYARALELVREVGALSPAAELKLSLDTGRAALLSLSLESGERALRHARELADELSDGSSGATARVLLSRTLNRQGRLQEATDQAKEAIPLAENAKDKVVLAQVYGAIAEGYQQWGQYGPDMTYLEPALQLATEAGDLKELGRLLQLAVMHAAGVGKYQRTEELLGRAKEIVSSNDDPLLECQVLKAETLLLFFSGDIQTSLEYSLKGFDLAHRHGLLELEVIFLHNAGDSHLRLDQMQEALYYFNESQRRAESARFDRLTEMNEMFIGFVEATYLQSQTGFDRLTRILERARRLGRVWNLTQGHQLLGRALAGRGELADARVHLEEALRLAESSGVIFFIDEARFWLGDLDRQH